MSKFQNAGAVMVVALATWCAAINAAEIHDAAELGDLVRVKACLDQDPKQINTADATGRTVLTRAALSGKKEIVEFLLEKGATEDVFAAAVVGHTDKIAGFLKQDKKLIDAKDSSGKAALHWAAMYGQKQVAELLLAEKATVSLLDEDGFTPLHWAAMFNRSSVAEVLVANKADFNIKDAKLGWTPLRLTVIHGYKATAEVLLNAGADPNVRDDDNIPLLHQAVLSNRKEMIDLLIARKANVNARDSDGETALGEALEQNNKEIAAILRKLGAIEK